MKSPRSSSWIRKPRQRLALGLLSACALLFPMRSSAAEVSWVGGNGSWHTATNWSLGQVPGPADDVVIDSPTDITVTLSGAASVKTLKCDNTLNFTNGSLDSTGKVTITGTLNWSGGEMVGAGTTEIASGGRLNILSSGWSTVLKRVLDNRGTTEFARSQLLLGQDNDPEAVGLFNNRAGGSFLVASNGEVRQANTGVSRFNNEGVLRKTVAGTAVNLVGVLRNTGVLASDEGRVLHVSGAEFAGGEVAPGSTLSVSGNNDVSGVFTVQGTMDFIHGTVGGEGELHVKGVLNWSGGEMIGMGATAIAPEGRLNILSSGWGTILKRVLDNRGTTEFARSQLFLGQDNVADAVGIFHNHPEGTFLVAANGEVRQANTGVSRFHNEGVLRKTAAGSAVNLVGVLRNDGVLASDPGHVLHVAGAEFAGGEVASGSTLSVSGDNDVSGLFTARGTMNFTHGTVGGEGELHVKGVLNWSGGEMVGAGTTVIAPEGRLNILSSGWGTVLKRVLDNYGTTEFARSQLFLGQNNEPDIAGVFHNRAGGTFLVASNGEVDRGRNRRQPRRRSQERRRAGQ